MTVANRRGGLLQPLAASSGFGAARLAFVGQQDLQMNAGGWVEWGSNEHLCQAGLIGVVPREAHR